MYPVTQNFLESMKALNRKVYGKVKIDYTDPFIDQSIAVQTNENANISYPKQTADSIQEPAGKILSLDGSCVLDGSYVLAPTAEESDTAQMGWWGSQLSGTAGVFSELYPQLTVSFMSRPIRELKVVGDSARQEWPADFTIKLYDNTDTVIYTETVLGNTEVLWHKVLDTAVTQVVKMELIISRWSHEGRQVKILEFFTSIQEVYEGEDIIALSLLEEREVSSSSLPVGTISANEIEIRLLNRNRKFDAGNKQSPLYEMLKANRRIKAWLGTESELVPLGTFWSGDWNAPEDNMYAQTTGRDRLELLRKSTYSTSQVQQDKTLYDLAVAVLEDAGLTDMEYWVDPELQDFTISYAYFESQSHREALRKIAEACLGQVYCDRNGIIRIEGPSYLESQLETAIDITQDDYFSKDNPVKWSEIANWIEVETQPLRPDAEKEVYQSNEYVEISAGETKTITAYYNETPCIDAYATISGTGNIVDAHYYAWGAVIKVASSTDGQFILRINAKPMKVLNKEKAIVKDEDSIIENGKLTYEFPNNPLIQTYETALIIAGKLLQYYKNPRRDSEITWRGNPALVLGDKVNVADRNEINTYHVVRQELDYDGGLKARLSGRRA